jgi:hypothetical protein
LNLLASAYHIQPVAPGSPRYRVSHADCRYECDSVRNVCACEDFFYRHRFDQTECKHLRMVHGFIAQEDSVNEPDLCRCELDENATPWIFGDEVDLCLCEPEDVTAERDAETARAELWALR